MVGVEAYTENPDDGHTLKTALQLVFKIHGFEPEKAISELGYRGHILLSTLAFTPVL